jgi:hypothetical protein
MRAHWPRCSAVVCLVVYALVSTSPPAVAQGDVPPYGSLTDKRVRFRPLRLGDTARMDVPQRDWRAVFGVGTLLAILTPKKGAVTVFVEEVPLNVPIEEDDMDHTYEAVQTEAITSDDAGAANVRHWFLPRGDRKVLIISFLRNRPLGTEHVTAYVINARTRLYRLVCITPAAERAAYAPLFGHMAASIVVSAAPVR